MTSSVPLLTAFQDLAEALAKAQFPLPLDGAIEARQVAAALADQTRDYLIPRAESLDAPLLAVVGGSTGAGKSTIVNSILGAELTRPGVLRPTTKSPVLVAHPDDIDWFRDGKVLPELIRSETPVHDSRSLQLVSYDALVPGLAILDAPDIDSVDVQNRRLARQLLRAADLWLFVTSGARYADAVGWEVLAQAAERNAVLSVVINRCPPAAMDDVKAHLGQMLAERGLGRVKLFAIPEFEMPANGMLPKENVAEIRSWLDGLAEATEQRAAVAMQTLAGTVHSLDPQLRTLVAAATNQHNAIEELRANATMSFRWAQQNIEMASGDGTMLRGEVLSRWQDFVGTGEFMRSVEQQISSWRDRITNWFTGEQKAESVQVAVSDGLAALIVEHTEAACERVIKQWQLTGWGKDIIAAMPELMRTSPGYNDKVIRSIRNWQGDLLKLVEEQGASKRLKARFLALGTNAAGAALIILVFASTGGLTTAEVGIAGGTSLLAQRLLEGVFGEDAVRSLTKQAKQQLDGRIDVLLSSQLVRYLEVVDELTNDHEVTKQLAQVADQLRAASDQAFAALTAPEGF